MTRHEMIKKLKGNGNMKGFLMILEDDQKEVTKFLKNAGPDTFQKIQGRLSIIDEYIELVKSILR